MRSIVALTLLAGVAAWVVVRHLPESEAVAEPTGHPQDIRSVALDGRGLPLAAMREAIETKPGTTIDAGRLSRDRATLEHLLETRGYLDARVDEPTITFGNGAYVVFSIERGAEYHVRDVKLVNVNERDVGVVTIGTWDTANPDRIELVRTSLEAATKKHVSVTVKSDPTASAVDLEFAVQP